VVRPTVCTTLAARNTPSGLARFLALPVLTLPCNRAKSCHYYDRPPLFDDEAHAVRAITSVILSLAYGLGHEREGYQRWSRFAGQAGGLAKVDSGLDYAANFSSFACVA